MNNNSPLDTASTPWVSAPKLRRRFWTTKRMVIMLLIGIGLTFWPARADAQTLPPAVPCPWEDTNNGDAGNDLDRACYWDADRFGNQQGLSYVAFPGGWFVYEEDIHETITSLRTSIQLRRESLRDGSYADEPSIRRIMRRNLRSERQMVKALRYAARQMR